MIKNMQVLLLVASATTGKTIDRAVECIEYYEGSVCGISAIFSAAKKIHGIEINTIFTDSDLPDYRAYSHADCPYCRQNCGLRLLSIVTDIQNCKKRSSHAKFIQKGLMFA